MQTNRFSFLDGIRGIAALFVLIRHTPELWGFTTHRSYLAVDLFFVLSGFVIAFAYDEKLRAQRLSAPGFVLVRMIRLYPMYCLSVVCCVLAELLKASSTGATLASVVQGEWHVIALSLLLLPSVAALNGNLYSLNGPAWSLFFEIIANVIYASIRQLLTTRRMLGLLAFFGLITVAGTLSHGDMDLGYAWGVKSMAMGFSRSMFGVFLGLFMHRHFHVLTQLVPRVSPWIATGIISLVLLSPDMGGLNRWADVVVVFMVFPLCVLWAAQGSCGRWERVLVALGAASYPVYVLHVPLSNLVALATHGSLAALAPLAGAVFAAAMVALSIWTEQVYDIPLRRWLTARIFANRYQIRHEDRV